MNAPVAYVVLASLVTGLMGLATAAGLRRWRRLDWAVRLIVICVAIHFLTAIASIVVILAGYRNRLLMEVPNFLATLAALGGFALWQPRPHQRRLVLGGAGLFVVLWVIAQAAQGTTADFSVYSGPLHAIALCAAAGFTLVTRVRVTADRWTGEVWFWICLALMLDFGTEVILAPLTLGLVELRRDLVVAAFYVHLVAGILGYGVMAWALWRVGAGAGPDTGTISPSIGAIGVSPAVRGH